MLRWCLLALVVAGVSSTGSRAGSSRVRIAFHSSPYRAPTALPADPRCPNPVRLHCYLSRSPTLRHSSHSPVPPLHPPHAPIPQTLTMRQQRVAAERKAMNDHLKKIAPYGIVEENLDTLLDRVTAKVAGEAQKVEKKHGQRMVAENMIYDQRLHRAEAKLRALEDERKNLTDTVRYWRIRVHLTGTTRAHTAHDNSRRGRGLRPTHRLGGGQAWGLSTRSRADLGPK